MSFTRSWLCCLVVMLAAESSSRAQNPPQAKTIPPAKQPAEAPAIPGLPPLPPGVELPDDVRAFLNKAMQESAKQKAAPAKNQPSAKAAPAKTAPTKSIVPPRPRAAASIAFKRMATEKSLGSIGDCDLTKYSRTKPHFWISPNGRRFAYVIEKQGIVIDGQQHMFPHMYRAGIKEGTFRFSPDSQHTVFVAWVDKQEETLFYDGVPENVGWNFIDHKGAVFSPDSQHIAYIARRYVGGGVEYALKIDGKEREVFKESPAWSLTFTPDNRRVVWGESVNDKYQMRETSIDGSEPRIERKHGPALLTMNFFYGGGGQLGYIAKEPEGKFFVVYDGQEHPLRFKELKSVLLSSDGKHMAYVAEPETFRNVVVKDGQPSQVYGGLEADYVKESLILSPNGQRWAYAIKKRNDRLAVIDGKEGKAYRDIAKLTFSPDSQHVAYRAALNNKLLIVVDGREGPGYDELGPPVFSPDGKSVAYGIGVGTQKFIVSNGQKQLPYADVSDPLFAPRGTRLAYQGKLDSGEWLINDSGREGKPYQSIEDQMYFSDDGQRLAAVVVDDDKEMVVVDGVEGNHYDTVVTLGGGRINFTGANQFHYLAAKNGQMFLVEETISP
jgi:hypothetical protein